MQQGLFHVQAAAVAHKLAVCADYPVTGYGDQNGVAVVGHTHGPGGPGISGGGGNLPIGARFPVRNGAQGLPHLLLKCGAPEDVGKIERPALAVQVFGNLLEYQAGQGGPPFAANGLTAPDQRGDRAVLVFNFELSEGEWINCVTVHMPLSQFQTFASRGVLHPRDAETFCVLAAACGKNARSPCNRKAVSKNGPTESEQLTTICSDWAGSFNLEVPPRFELGVELLQSSALPLGYGTNWNAMRSEKMERVTRLELATSTLARWRSTR